MKREYLKQKYMNKNKEVDMKKIVTRGTDSNKGITLIALVITIVLNCSYLAMDQMNKIEKI